MAGLSDWEQEIEDKIQALAAHVGFTPEPPVSSVNVGAEHAGNAPSAEDVAVTDAAAKLAEEQGIDLAAVEPTGASGQVTVADVKAAT